LNPRICLKRFIPDDEVTTNHRFADPIDGRSLRLRFGEDKIVIDSVGANVIDESGVLSNEKTNQGDFGYAVEK